MSVGSIVLFAYVEGFHSANVTGAILSVGAAIGAALYKVSGLLHRLLNRSTCIKVYIKIKAHTHTHTHPTHTHTTHTHTHPTQVLLKWRFGDASLFQMSLFLSSLSVFASMFLWPVPLLLHLLGIELLHNVPWTYLFTSSVLGVVFNFSINFGIAYTFPLFISLGTILGIPLNAIIDMTFRGVNFFNWKFVATDLIIAGFLVMLLPPSDSIFLQKQFMRIIKCANRPVASLNS